MIGSVYQSPFDSTVPSYDFTLPIEIGAKLEETAPGITGVITSQKIPGEDWTTTLQRVLPALVATYQQKQILGIQLERAKQGLDPLDASSLGVGVNVGLSPDLTRTLGILGIGSIAAYLILRKVK